MKGVVQYLELLKEDATPTNTVGGGNVALQTPPLGTVGKRKKVEESTEGVTTADSSEEEKRKFQAKQAAQQDYSLSGATSA